MNDSPQHTFQVLTKRTQRLKEIAPKLQWTPNIWLGVSVESDRYINRINDLSGIPSKIKYVSFEPLIAPISQLSLRSYLHLVDWVIVGGETGPRARPQPAFLWVDDIHERCWQLQIPFFFKQWTTKTKANEATNQLYKGQTWHQYPEVKP